MLPSLFCQACQNGLVCKEHQTITEEQVLQPRRWEDKKDDQ